MRLICAIFLLFSMVKEYSPSFFHDVEFHTVDFGINDVHQIEVSEKHVYIRVIAPTLPRFCILRIRNGNNLDRDMRLNVVSHRLQADDFVLYSGKGRTTTYKFEFGNNEVAHLSTIGVSSD